MIALAALVTWSSGTATARAGTAEVEIDAATHVARAEAAMSEQRYADAIAEYQAAYTETSDPRLSSKLADAYALSGDCDEAEGYLRRLLRTHAWKTGDDPDLVVQTIRAHLAECRTNEVPTEEVQTSSPTSSQSYGKWMVAIDVVSALLIPVAGIGIIGYLVGGPAMHSHEGNGAAVPESLALRLLLPIAGALGGVAIGRPRDMAQRASPEGCPDGECLSAVGFGLAGAALGMLIAIVIDDGLLARKRMPASVPIVAARDGGLTFGIAGGF